MYNIFIRDCIGEYSEWIIARGPFVEISTSYAAHVYVQTAAVNKFFFSRTIARGDNEFSHAKFDFYEWNRGCR